MNQTKIDGHPYPFDPSIPEKTDYMGQIGKGIRVAHGLKRSGQHIATVTFFKLKPNSGYENSVCVCVAPVGTCIRANMEHYIIAADKMAEARATFEAHEPIHDADIGR